MLETIQLEEKEPTQLHEAPKLLVEWSSPWREFKTAIRPAMRRSGARLAGEAPYGMRPFGGMVLSMCMEAFLIFAVIALRAKIEQLRPYVAPRLSSHDVIYYSGDELPRTEDLGGAQAGASGRAGGEEAHHRTQTIRIARGRSLAPQVVDAPNLKLPSSRDAVANLLAIKTDPGPPPSEGMRSNRRAMNFPATVVAPAPNAIRDYTRNGVKLDSVIAPAPSVPHDPFRAAPNLSASVIPPAPKVSSDRTLVAPALGAAVIPPSPSVSREHVLTAPALQETVVAPAPSVSRDKSRATPALNASVIPPAPNNVSRDAARTPVQANEAVVPPPASAPERASARNPKLTMPSAAVIAPPPSADATQDLRHLSSGNAPDPSKAVVPPPPAPAPSSSGSLVSSLLGKIFGASEVVPPPPAVNAESARSAGTAPAANTSVVPPPPVVGSGSTGGGNPRGSRNGTGATLGARVIAPPPSDGVSGGTGTRPMGASSAPSLGPPSVVPPPPSLAGTGGGAGATGGGNGAPGGTLQANNVIPPPPSVGGGSSPSGSGVGRRGSGVGGPMDAGSGVAPPATGGSGPNTGAVISSDPGAKVGLPSSGGKGSLAMSPGGGDKPGIGGTGGGTSIGHGSGPGSGMKGTDTGAGKSGTGVGSDPNAHGGISPNAGPGGAGNATSGTPPVPGVAVTGGSTIVTLPSFGSDPAANDLSSPARSSAKQQHQTLNVDVVASASSGGAFEPYKNLLHGEKHTTYLDTTLGTVVMEYADEASAGRATAGPLTAPQQIRTELPDGLPHARMVLTGTLDTSGNLKNLRVLEAGPAGMTARILPALRAWKLEPAMRGGQPVEVTAILGFGINTDDRF